MFDPPLQDLSAEKGEYVAHHPVSALRDQAPIEFVIPADLDHYDDFARSSLYLQLRLLKSDGAIPTADDKTAHGAIAPVDNLLHSLFSQAELKLNGQTLSSSDCYYPYSSYVENLLNSSPSALSSWLTGELFHGDTHGLSQHNALAEGAEANPDLKKRYEMFSGGKMVEASGRLKLPLSNQTKYLLPGIEKQIKLNRTANTFHLVGGNVLQYKIEIVKAVFYSRRVKLSPSLMVTHARLLSGGTQAKYPFTRTAVTTFSIAQGSLSFNRTQINSGFLPQRIIVGFIANANQNGQSKLNPFCFTHQNVNFLQLSIPGQSFPTEAYNPNYERGQYLRNFLDLSVSTGVYATRFGHGIPFHTYPRGSCFYALDLTAGLNAGQGAPEGKRFGSLNLDVRFDRPLEGAVNCVLYAEHQAVVKCDFARNVTADYLAS